MKDLFYLPAKAAVKRPKGLGRAVVAGGASFARHTMLAAVGVGAGLVGAAIRPTARLAKLATRAGGEGEARATHSVRVGRVRPPRMLHGEQHRIAPYSIAEALARHVLQSTLGGQYLHEPMLHCELLGVDEVTTIAVLTGLRLLTVDASSWRVQLNLQLRKVRAVQREGQALALQLVARRGAAGRGGDRGGEGRGGGSTTSLAVAGETRQLPCFSDKAATTMLSKVQEALSLAHARQKVWQAVAA